MKRARSADRTQPGLPLKRGRCGSVLSAVDRIKDRIPDGAACVAIHPDRGERYLETLFSDDWVREHFGEVEHLWRDERTTSDDLRDG